MAVLTLTALCALGFVASSASAALTQTPFGCRASVARVTLLDNITVEPYAANNSGTPCANGSTGVGTATVPTTGTTILTAGPVGAFTYSAFDKSGQTAPGAAAVASVEGVTIPSPGGNIYIAGPIQATANYSCVNNQLVAQANSTLNVIYVGNVAHTVPTGTETVINLGAGAYIAVNLKTQTPTSLTEQILRVHIPGLADVVVGEAQVTANSPDACAGTQGQPPVLEICPPGSKLNVVAQKCEIHDCGQTIIVSRPFRGPSGGTVMALCSARKKYKSPCLSGPGPKYALIATKRGARVEGTLYSDRILAIGSFERVAGLGGNDCLDGKGRSEKLYDGNGKERIYSSGGNNRIGIGNGNSRIYGGSGNDRITVGNGNDTISGGGGHNVIDAGIGRDHIYGGPGLNRIWTPGINAVVNCGTGGHNMAFLRSKAIPYAAAHGCNRIIHLL